MQLGFRIFLKQVFSLRLLRENTPSNKTEALTESMNMYIWAIGILNQLFIRDSYTQIKFSKK